MTTAAATRGCVPAETTRQRLRETIGVYYRANIWTLAWCRQVKAGIPEKDIDGLFLNAYEMRLLGLDLGVVLRQIAACTCEAARKARPPLDYWSRAVQRYAYRVPDGDLRWDRPGFEVPENGAVEKVQFRPNPKHLPFSDLCESLRRYGRPLGLKSWNLLFSYNGVTVENASILADVVKTSGTSSLVMVKALDSWRDRLFAMIDAHDVSRVTAQAAEHEPEGDTVVDPRLKGMVLARPQLAKLLGKNPRTLKNWDDIGYVPSGVKWFPADKVSGNVALYVVEKNWPAIQSVLPEGREVDKQLAEELLRLKMSDDEE